ncbi:MAG TPA: hypothetical protein VN436_07960 [Holophaga sp.]|nr:hypothetical protein [Holophaga sp.]
MWFCFNDSFLSIVQKGGEPGQLCVRARMQGDIERVFPDALVTESMNTDYRFRAFIDREQVIKAVTGRIQNLDYPNFKSSVKDPERHDAYLSIWSVMYGMQQRELRRETWARLNEHQTQLPFDESQGARNAGTKPIREGSRRRA